MFPLKWGPRRGHLSGQKYVDAGSHFFVVKQGSMSKTNENG